ncbi:hypothetical protein Asd1617_04720 [Shigella dysenteriae 1617]|uniref:Uncharacterized protein n=1 Tax=Shigella dysenteriae 1617 TaxID=754093 RepID=A0A0A7A005_SHIDY|nr:hypothetical protein Asd1617_04720 [Shigella dysenteriae 1617]
MANRKFSLGKTGRESMAPRLRTQFMLGDASN